MYLGDGVGNRLRWMVVPLVQSVQSVNLVRLRILTLRACHVVAVFWRSN